MPAPSKIAQASPLRKSLLLQLPQEIQDKIYQYAVTEDKPVDIRLREKRFPDRKITMLIPRVLRIDRDNWEKPCVNSLAYTHTSIAHTVFHNNMFWKVNEFTFPEPPAMTKYLRKLTPEQRASIPIITVARIRHAEDITPYITFLAENCTGLRELKLDITSLTRFLGCGFPKHRPLRKTFSRISIFKAMRNLRGLEKFEFVYVVDEDEEEETAKRKCWFGKKPKHYDRKLGKYTDWAFAAWTKELKVIEKRIQKIIAKKPVIGS